MAAYKPEKGAAWRRGMQDIGPYAGLAWQIMSAMLLFVGGGAWLDHTFETTPLWILVGVGLAFTAVGGLLYRIVKETTRTPGERSVKPPRSGAQDAP